MTQFLNLSQIYHLYFIDIISNRRKEQNQTKKLINQIFSFIYRYIENHLYIFY